MSTLAERIRAALHESGLTQAELARSCSVSGATVNDWLSGKTKTLRASTAIAAAAALKVDIAWLESGKGSVAPKGNIATTPRPVMVVEDDTPLTDDEIEVPRLTLVASCGNGRLNWEIDYKGTPNRFRKSWCMKRHLSPEKLVTIVAEGDSMSPGIPNGASVTIDTSAAGLKSGKRHAIDYMGEFFIKRLFRQPDGSVLVRSDNPDKTAFPDWAISTEHGEALRILGRPVSVAADTDD